jgi:hypothetical protein
MKPDRVLVATLNVATLVSTGERRGSDSYAPPKVLQVEDAARPKTVNEAVSLGVTLLAHWAKGQRGSTEWPARLQVWLDDWQNDFRRSDAGDEAAGFRRLAELLGNMSRAIHASGALQ